MQPPPSIYRIALVANDRRIYVHDLATGNRMPVTHGVDGMAFDWPTWSPDGRSLAFVGAAAGAGLQSDMHIYVSDLRGDKPREIYSEAGVSPFYLSWSPDGSQIAFLGSIAGGLRLKVVTAKGEALPWSVDGQPNFFSWRPDGTELLMHMGGSGTRNPEAFIARVDVRTGDMKRLTLAPADFRAPAWSPDGRRMLLAAVTNSGMGVVTMDEQGEGDVLALFTRDVYFQWSPDATRAAALLGVSDRQTPGGHLYMLGTADRAGIPAADKGGRRISEDDILGFWWSPDGRHIAYFAVDLLRRLLTLHSIDLEKGGRARLASLAPSDSTRLLLGFFDQYARSSSFWSPDGKYFAYAGITMREQSNGHQHQRDENEVFVVAIDGSEPPRSLGSGQLAVFAPGI